LLADKKTLEARSAPLMASKYSVCSAVKTGGPAVPEVGLGAEDCVDVASALEHAESPRVSAASNTIARLLICLEFILNTL
jgi:hypothetical protein